MHHDEWDHDESDGCSDCGLGSTTRHHVHRGGSHHGGSHHSGSHHNGNTVCPSCEIGPFLRNHYFTGKLLLERDFTTEQQYFIDKLRHHHQRLHGWGVVCGLKVKQHPNEKCRNRFVCIEPGTAIDCCGHEIILREEECIDITKFPEVAKLIKEHAAQPPDPDGKGGEAHTLHICIQYRECGTEEIPVLYDDCGCDDTRCAPNRILESYEILVKVGPPPEFSATEDKCEEIKWHHLAGCPHCESPNCVVLATIENWRPGMPIIDTPPLSAIALPPAAIINNRLGRKVLPSVETLLELIECVQTHGSGGGVGPPGKGVDKVTAEFLPCVGGQPDIAGASATISEPVNPGDPRVLNLKIPGGCKGEPGTPGPGLAGVDLRIVDCDTPESVAVVTDPATGQQSIKLVIPSGCAKQRLTHICGVNWIHPPERVDGRRPIDRKDMTPLAALARGLIIAFDGPVRSGDIHDQTFLVLAQSVDRLTKRRCWCEVPSEKIVGIELEEECSPQKGIKKEADPNDPGALVNGALFVPAKTFEGGLQLRVVLKGDFIRDEIGRAIDADHVPPWLPGRPTGDGIEGGTFESWLIIRPD